MSIALAADIGGTHIRTALVDEKGTILYQHRIKADLSVHGQTDAKAAEDYVLNTIHDALTDQLHAGKADVCGIGFPGFFAGNTGLLASSPNLPLLAEVRFGELLSERIGMPVVIQNDGLAAAVGEFRFGAGKGSENLLHITLGTGVGGGAVLHGAPHAGDHGMAMEIGHLTVVRDGRPCGCGAKGCLETYASATAVTAHFRKISGMQAADSRAVFNLAQSGNRDARTAIAEAGKYLGIGIAEATKLLDVQNVTISGGLAGAWSLLHPPLVESLNTNLIPPLKGKINVLLSRLADDAGLLGAAALAVDFKKN